MPSWRALPYNIRLFCEVKDTMSHAIIRAGGKQFLVEEGQTIRVPSIEADAGSSIELETLLTAGANGCKDLGDGGRPRPRSEDRGLQEKAAQTIQAHAWSPSGLHNIKIDSIG